MAQTSFGQLAFNMAWPPDSVFGCGKIKLLGDNARRQGWRRALIVTDAGVHAAGIDELVAQQLRAAGVQATSFPEVNPNPTIAEVEKAVGLIRAEGYDAIVAVGGGSSIDASKVISMRLLTGRSLDELNTKGADDVAGTPIHFYAVPTTSGTGSEATTGALLKSESGTKYLLRSARCRPQLTVLDPELTVSLPERVTASTGMDAFIHAFGSYTNTNINPIADICAREAIRLVSQYLPLALKNKNDLDARAAMMLASHLAGVSISQKGNDAIHGLSTAVESHVNCPHGESLSALMEPILRFNQDHAAEKYADIGQLMRSHRDEGGRALSSAEAVEEMINLRNIANTSTSLRKLGVTDSMLEPLAQQASKGRSTLLNCRPMTVAQVKSILNAAM